MGRRSARTKDEVERFINQRVRNPPRMRVKGNIGENTILHGVEVANTISTDAAGNASLVIPLIGGSAIGMSSTATPLAAVAKIYNQFLYQSSKLVYIPSVGLNTAGNVTVTFLNNTEICHYLLDGARTFAEISGVVLGQANAVSHPVWHEFSYPMKITPKRKRFDVNTTNAAATLDTVERDCQGVFVVVITGSSPSTIISTPRRESRMLLEGLSTVLP